MTSNVGSTGNTTSIGFGTTTDKIRDKVMSSLKETFRPEFLNRVDEIVVFDALSNDELTKIIDLMLADTQKVLNDRNIKMYVSKEAKNYILEKGTDIKYGARPLRRAVQKYIEDELSEMILRSELKNGNKVYVDLNKDSLKYDVKE
jgi:ATP-dependent Clp protease ATP-binding subunit ClpA